MACRCQERRLALKRAAQASSIKDVGRELGFVASTMAEDAKRALLGAPNPKDSKEKPNG